MKFDRDEDWRVKIANIKRLAANIRARKRPIELTALNEAEHARIEDLTRFEQLKGVVLKQNGRRPRSLSG